MFFSDLDRTLIYSKRFAKSMEHELVLVEQKEGRDISYMTPDAFDTLRQLRMNAIFVPVTARKWDEICRVNFVVNDLPEWIVCEAGRTIYHFGEREREWDEHILHLMRAYESNHQEAIQRFFRDMQALGFPAWHINEQMVMTKVEGLEKDKWDELFSQVSWYQERGINLLIQERKVYLIPELITKGSAVRYLIEKLQPLVTVSAGDAEMDADMFVETTHHIAPKHHTISDRNINISEQAGLNAAEDILAFAKSKLLP
jgi:hydroxymethylpyrimidine pyrophosphatase-like HAD family hydrolase